MVILVDITNAVAPPRRQLFASTPVPSIPRPPTPQPTTPPLQLNGHRTLLKVLKTALSLIRTEKYNWQSRDSSGKLNEFKVSFTPYGKNKATVRGNMCGIRIAYGIIQFKVRIKS
jgi:hypothetical protein